MSGPLEVQKELKLIKESVGEKCCENDCLGKLPVGVILQTRQQSRELKVRCSDHVDHFHLFLLGHMDTSVRDGEKTERSKKKKQ